MFLNYKILLQRQIWLLITIGDKAMTFYSNKKQALKKAQSYGYNYKYDIKVYKNGYDVSDKCNGMYYIKWHTLEPLYIQ